MGKGSNEKFNGTLGKTPQSNGIGGILDVTGSLKGDILTMRATGSVKCNGTAYEWVYHEANQTIYAGRTIVGSVIREKAHPAGGGPTCDQNKKNPKGETGSFWMVLATTP